MSNTPSPQQTQRLTSSSMQRDQEAASAAAPVFTPAFGFEDLEEQDDEVQHQFGHALSLTSPNHEFVFSNNLECYDDDEFAFHDDDKAACMRSVPQRDTAIAFDPMMMRATSEAFMETNVFNGKTPTFVLNTAPLSPTFGEQTFDFLAHLPTISKNTKLPAASPLSPSAYISKIEVPQKERSDFYSVNPVFTSHEAPAKIMDTVKSALATLNCEFEATEAWTLKVNCLLVAELITFSIHVFQLRGVTTKYEIEFVRHSGDELVFADLAEHIRSLCSDVDEEGALSLFSKTLEPWLNDKQELSGRRYAIKEAEALSLVDELNCEHLHVDSLYQVARSIKNHCRHKGNRKLFLQEADTHKEFLKGLKWMLADNEELTRFALFTMLQFAADEDLSSSFFSTPFEKSSFSLQLDALLARDAAPRGLCTKFTSDMVAAVQHSALFA